MGGFSGRGSATQCACSAWCARNEHYQRMLWAVVCTTWYDLFNLPSMLQAPTPIQQALEQCHQVQATAPPDHSGCAKVKGGRVCRVPGGTMKIIAATYSPHHPADALFEPLSNGLPACLLASPAMIRVNRDIAYFPIVNIRVQDVVLYPRTILGTLSHASLISLPPGLKERKVTAAVSSQTVTGSM